MPWALGAAHCCRGLAPRRANCISAGRPQVITSPLPSIHPRRWSPLHRRGSRRTPWTPFVTMKPIHKRLYTALPRTLASAPATSTPTPSSRVRSNSGCSARSLYTASSSTLPFAFFDSPAPPPSSRPGSTNLVISTRLAAEAKAEVESNPNSPYSNSGQHNTPGTQSQNSGPPPYSLAFSSGQSDSAAQLPSSHLSLFFPYPSFGSASSWQSAINPGHDGAHPAKRQRTRYHLDVGAYGIPKRSRGAAVAGRDGRLPKSFGSETQSAKDQAACQAVQVGEDAYFVRDNAMGVADGVGGWSRVRHPGGYLRLLLSSP